MVMFSGVLRIKHTSLKLQNTKAKTDRVMKGGVYEKWCESVYLFVRVTLLQCKFNCEMLTLFEEIKNERFDDFTDRYGKGVETEQAKEWREKTKEIERELFQ